MMNKRDDVIVIDEYGRQPYPTTQVLEAEQGMLDVGVPKHLVFANKPIVPTQREADLIMPLVIPLVGMWAKRFIENLAIVEVCGPLVTIDYELMGEVDPRCVVPVTMLENAQAMGRLLLNLTYFVPGGRQEALVKDLSRDFEAVAGELRYRLRQPHFDYFFQMMSKIVFMPTSWYGQTRFANRFQRQWAEHNKATQPRVQQAIRARRIPLRRPRQRPQRLIDLEAAVRRGEVHYTVYEAALQAERRR